MGQTDDEPHGGVATDPAVPSAAAQPPAAQPQYAEPQPQYAQPPNAAQYAQPAGGAAGMYWVAPQPIPGINIKAPIVGPQPGQQVVAYQVVLLIFFWPLAWVPCVMAECHKQSQRPVYGYPPGAPGHQQPPTGYQQPPAGDQPPPMAAPVAPPPGSKEESAAAV